MVHGRRNSLDGWMPVILALLHALSGISCNGFGARLLSRRGCRRMMVVVIMLGGIATITVIVVPVVAMRRWWRRSVPSFSLVGTVSIMRMWRRLAMSCIVVRRRWGSSVVARMRWCVKSSMRKRGTVMIRVGVVGIDIATIVGTMRRIVTLLFGVGAVVATFIGTPRNRQQFGLVDDALGPVVDVSERSLFSLLADLFDVILLLVAIFGNLAFVDLTEALLALDVLPLLFVRSFLPHSGQKLGGIGIANSGMSPLDLGPLAVGIGQEGAHWALGGTWVLNRLLLDRDLPRSGVQCLLNLESLLVESSLLIPNGSIFGLHVAPLFGYNLGNIWGLLNMLERR